MPDNTPPPSQPAPSALPPAQTAPLTQPFGFADAIFLALVTATAYLLAYSFERSYCQYFSIPLDLIRISTESLISSCVCLIAFTWTCFYFINLVVAVILDPRIKRGSFAFFLLSILAALIGLGIIFGLAGGYSWKGFRTYVLCVSILLGATFALGCVLLIFDFFLGKLASKVTGKTIEMPLAEAMSGQQRFDGIRWVSQRVERRYVLVPTAITLLYILAGLAGMQTATYKRSFPLIKSMDLVVIRRFNDTFVCKPLKSNPEGIGSDVTLLGLDEFKGKAITVYKFKAEPVLDEKDGGYYQ